ncbi:MAG: lysophospholipase [Myxococcota bacterium]|jgi:alpha-beta hydrolase superfamily lysophospholipase
MHTEIRRTESHLPGSTGQLLFRRSWLPRSSERIIILVHGYGEHSGRYEHTASDLARAGYEVHAYDQQGHGRSGGTRCHVRRFDHLLDDLEGFVAAVRAERPPLPIVVVGHSMGGLLVAAYASQRNPRVAGVVTSAAALAMPEDLSRARVIAVRGLKWLAPRLSLASKLDPTALSRDPDVVRAYLEDPLVQRKITASLASEMLSAMKRTEAAAVGVPMLLLHGEDDRICPVAGSRSFFEQLTVTQRGLRTYPGLRHEIFNEPERAAVLGDLVGWVRELG